MSRYIPMPAYPDMMPVDISFVFEDEKPAGKHGFVHADGEDLRFEDGTLARFWGVNVNGGACFPDKDYAPKCARRLAQAGCNIIRFHQLDAEWDTPNLFGFSKGKRVTTTRQMDPRSLDALDYFISCLKAEGVYIYLDMLTYRKFKEGDGVPEVELLGDLAKPWCMTSQCLIDLQKEFATQIWNHVNPYTGLAYKDEPAIVLTEIVNECDLFATSFRNRVSYVEPPYYANEMRQQLKTWLEEQNLTYDWETCDLFAAQEPLVAFRTYLTRKYHKQMHDHLRSIGVKIPITGTNWGKSGGNLAAQQDMDFMDGHHYHYDWRWGNTERVCQHRSITATRGCTMSNMLKVQTAGKPFFCSEWDMPWPNSYRAEGPIYYAAVGALQGWSGFTIHTYAYSTRLDKMDVLGRELSSPVGGVPYREGIFSTWNDPAKFGLFYHAALITRRCDITPAEKKVAVHCADMAAMVNKPFTTLAEQHRTATCFTEQLPEGYDEIISENDAYPMSEPNRFVSDNGQMWRDLSKQIGAIDTPRTQCLYGKLGLANNKSSIMKKVVSGIQLSSLTVDCRTDFAVVALSSLTDDPIETTDNMLLSTIGRARNTHGGFDGDKMLEVGEPPILAEVIQGTISIKTEHGKRMKVWGVNAEGFYAAQLQTEYEDGWLSFNVGDEENPACYYLIVKE